MILLSWVVEMVLSCDKCSHESLRCFLPQDGSSPRLTFSRTTAATSSLKHVSSWLDCSPKGHPCFSQFALLAHTLIELAQHDKAHLVTAHCHFFSSAHEAHASDHSHRLPAPAHQRAQGRSTQRPTRATSRVTHSSFPWRLSLPSSRGPRASW